ncbi:MAG: hypothetical protein QW231_05775, partial [Candidatus Bathyarchaeia archaeon]
MGGGRWIRCEFGPGWGWTEAPYQPYRYGDTWRTFDYWKNLYGDVKVLYIAAGLEYWAVEPNFGQHVYVDCITVNGVTYDLE